MDDLHFTTISLQRDLSGIHDVHARLVSVVHDYNTSPFLDRIAIAFPHYREGISTDTSDAEDYGEEQRLIRLRKGFLGQSIRLFGTADGLRAVLDVPQAQFLHETPDLVVTAPTRVPDVQHFGCYVAHKGLTNLTPSRLRRAIRRQAWLRDPKCLTPAQLEQRQADKNQRAKSTRLPYVGVRSRSNGSMFSIFIERQNSPTLRFAPNSFGFSSKHELCSLPVF
jgi:CRISPR-associated endoribonuclease Cas6/Csy4 subtype I-F